MWPLQSASIQETRKITVQSHVRTDIKCADHPRCWPIVRPRPSLWSPVPGVQSAIASPITFPACISTDAPWRRRPGRCLPFHAPIHPRHRPIVQRRLMGGVAAIPRPIIWGPIGHCACPVVLLPYPPPAILRSFGCATAHYGDRSMGSQHRPGTASGTGRQSPPHLAHTGDPTLITPVKCTYSKKARVSIETREMRLSTQECDFPRINIPNTHYVLQCTAG